MYKIIYLFLISSLFSCLRKKEIQSELLYSLIKEKKWKNLQLVLEKINNKNDKLYFLEAFVMYQLGDLDYALEIFEKKLQPLKGNQNIQLLKARILYSANKKDEAEKILLILLDKNFFSYETLKLFFHIKYEQFKGNLNLFLSLKEIDKLKLFYNDIAALNILALRELLINLDPKKSSFYLYKAVNLGEKHPVYASVILNFAILADKYFGKVVTAKNFYQKFLNKNFGTEDQRNIIKKRLNVL